MSQNGSNRSVSSEPHSGDVLLLPDQLDIEETDRGLCFTGPAEAVAEFCRGSLRAVRTLPEGGFVSIGKWRLCVSETVPYNALTRSVTMPRGRGDGRVLYSRAWSTASTPRRCTSRTSVH